MVKVDSVLIVGGGIAGLTLATALHRQGIRAELVECSSSWQTIGAGILLHANGMRALRTLGLDKAVEQLGSPVPHWSFWNQQGELLCQTNLEALWGEVGPCIGITRATLQQILLAEIATNVPYRLGTTVTLLTQDAQGVRVNFSDGTSGHYILVVGADGLNSTVRRLVFGDGSAEYSGLMVWRSLAPICQKDSPDMMVLLGDGRVFGLVPVGYNLTYGFAIAADPRYHDPLEGRLDRVRQRFGAFGGQVQKYLGALTNNEQIHCAPIEWVNLGQWHSGRVLLIGDAAHAGPPMMAQGGCMALEDACVLAVMLGEGTSIEAVLDEFVCRRKPRTEWVQQQSRAWAES